MDIVVVNERLTGAKEALDNGRVSLNERKNMRRYLLSIDSRDIYFKEGDFLNIRVWEKAEGVDCLVSDCFYLIAFIGDYDFEQEGIDLSLMPFSYVYNQGCHICIERV
ncbi:hypothetical protein [Listeria rustica]|uniref:Uncharacterized protein n=1 Tax=Listeria rustica TaxID=2713503 RepID=A0A7W1T4Z1_9LIST|nr:hypothetical protein [Listeria rustica]MBA3925524.1 hypothetical protein [Listeria rustica]